MDVSRCDGGQEAVERESSCVFHIVRMPHRVAPIPPSPDFDDRVPIQQAGNQSVPVLAEPILVRTVVCLPIHHNPWAWQVSPGLLILAYQCLVKDAGRANVAHIQAELIAVDAGDMPSGRQ